MTIYCSNSIGGGGGGGGGGKGGCPAKLSKVLLNSVLCPAKLDLEVGKSDISLAGQTLFYLCVVTGAHIVYSRHGGSKENVCCILCGLL